MLKINEEVGLRNLSKITKEYKNFEIWFHKDLDGVTTALAMKTFLENYYNLKLVDCHIIQYGNLEYAIKSGKSDSLKVMCDFAHGKPMFHIQLDHHDSQVGAGDTDSTYFKKARSNVEIISGEISYNDVFTPEDIELIKTVDSANFLAHNIKPEDIQNSIFKYEKDESIKKNKFMMGFVVNRLLLAYKSKRISVRSLDGKRNHVNRNILECLLIDSSASLYSMFNNLRNYINNAKTNDKLGRLATPEEIKNNLSDYIERMKDYGFVEDESGDILEVSNREMSVLKSVINKKQSENNEIAKSLQMSNDEFDIYVNRLLDKKYLFINRDGSYFIGDTGRKILSGKRSIKGIHMDEDYKILIQYGGGNMFKPGSYDRYTPFKNYPNADFLCIVWPIGLIQVSCNPFIEKKIKKINLGEIAKEVLAEYKPMLSQYYISLESIKNEFENSQDWKKMQKEEGNDYEGVGFKFSDLYAFYSDCVYKKENNKIVKVDINNDDIKSAMNTIQKSLSYEQKTLLDSLKIPIWEIIIRNSGGHPSITNISGLNFLKYNKKMLKIAYNTDKYVDVLKKIARDFVDNLKIKIDAIKSGKDISYDTKGVELIGQDTNENKNYKNIFTKVKLNKSRENNKKGIIEKFENFQYSFEKNKK